MEHLVATAESFLRSWHS